MPTYEEMLHAARERGAPPHVLWLYEHAQEIDDAATEIQWRAMLPHVNKNIPEGTTVFTYDPEGATVFTYDVDA